MKPAIRHSLLSILMLLACTSCGDDAPPSDPVANTGAAVTFYEIGSDHCEPCKLMRPIMESLQTKYGEEQLKVLFLDVIKNKAEADHFKIRVMPTQVFLGEHGEEFHRHEGFYPEAKIDSLLQKRGLRTLTGR